MAASWGTRVYTSQYTCDVVQHTTAKRTSRSWSKRWLEGWSSAFLYVHFVTDSWCFFNVGWLSLVQKSNYLWRTEVINEISIPWFYSALDSIPIVNCDVRPILKLIL